jgi:hypothetical protein
MAGFIVGHIPCNSIASRMERMRKTEGEREGKMHDENTTVAYESVVNTFRLCFPKDYYREIGYCPLKLGVKTVGVKAGFYHELLENSCRVKVSATDIFKYLWRTRNRIEFSVFSQN